MDMNGKLSVFVIFNPKQYTKEAIVDIIKEEGYPNYFFFNTEEIPTPMRESAMDVADEVWTFGIVESIPEYDLAKQKGKDIWIMG